MEFTTLGGAVGEAPSNWWGAGPAIHQYMILSSSNFLQAYMDSLQGLGCPNISPPTVASAKNCQILGRQRCPCESRHNGTFLRVHWSSMFQPQPPKVLVAPQFLLDQFLTLVGLLSHMDDPERKLYNLQNYNVYIYTHMKLSCYSLTTHLVTHIQCKISKIQKFYIIIIPDLF